MDVDMWFGRMRFQCVSNQVEHARIRRERARVYSIVLDVRMPACLPMVRGMESEN